MAGIAPIVPGIPGVRTAFTAVPRVVFRQIELMGGLAQGKLIDGANAADPGNTGDTDRLRAGCILGKITSGGLYGSSIFGRTVGTTSANGTAYTSGGTSICVTPAAAVEIVRRIGTSGNLNYVGPPAAAGTVAVLGPIAYSAVNTTTGVITTSTLGANLINGAFVCPNDGSQNPLTFVPDGFPLAVSDESGTRITVQFPAMPVAGIVDSTQLIEWPADTSLQTWLLQQLSSLVGGKFVFSSVY